MNSASTSKMHFVECWRSTMTAMKGDGSGNSTARGGREAGKAIQFQIQVANFEITETENGGAIFEIVFENRNLNLKLNCSSRSSQFTLLFVRTPADTGTTH